MTTFTLTDEEEQQVKESLEEIKPEILKKQNRNDPFDLNKPYYGAIGGGVTYSFTPTGLGMIIEVTEGITGLTLDLTDVDSW